jgi:hypothetical protein
LCFRDRTEKIAGIKNHVERGNLRVADFTSFQVDEFDWLIREFLPSTLDAFAQFITIKQADSQGREVDPSNLLGCIFGPVFFGTLRWATGRTKKNPTGQKRWEYQSASFFEA